jgi:DHA1 family bicyclomycin/chloramphenicol resistance-like MFS transporter
MAGGSLPAMFVLKAPCPMFSPTTRPREPEFIALVAILMAMVAMSIDSMLPALGVMASDLGAREPNDRQLILSMLFLGLCIGQLFYGPLSDAIGRRRALVIGLVCFVAGSFLCAVATSFEMLLAGRILQGFGAAGPRIVSVAMVRDQHEGRSMARIMSMSMSVFILVPVFAPAIGQGVLLFASWRTIFAGLCGMGAIAFFWFMMRQPETLSFEKRKPFTAGGLWRAVVEVMGHRISLGYIIATGCIFGAFIGYLNSTQQIFGEAYGLGAAFPLYFGSLAAGLGVASIINSRLVMRFGMQYLSMRAGIVLAVTAVLLMLTELALGALPPLWLFMAAFGTIFFCSGVLFGNYNALAMEPMGHIAGSASAIIGTATTGLSLIIGTVIGQAYDGTALPVAIGFALMGVGAVSAQAWAESGRAALAKSA